MICDLHFYIFQAPILEKCVICYINLTKKLVVPLKNRKKKWGHFLFLDILKMSNFQNAKNKFSKKNEKTVFTQGCFKYQKNTSKCVTINFYSFFGKGF
ncbi:hypothetical protein EB093_08025 [bacterium]|nr:hypothetical protein [bacterium]